MTVPTTTTRWGAAVPLVLLGAALVVGALGGGMLTDAAVLDPESVDMFGAVATPICTALVAAALALSMTRQAAWRLTPILLCFGLFGFWAALSLAGSAYLGESVQSLSILLTALAAGAVAARQIRSRRDALLMAGLLALVVAIPAGIGVNEYLINLRAHNPAWRVFGGFANPDFLAGFLVLGIPLTAALFIASRERSLTLAAGVGFLLQTLCLWRTQSRFGAATMLVGLILLGVLVWRYARRDAGVRKRGLAIVVLVVLAVAVGARQLIARLHASHDEAYSARFRLYTWSGASHMARAHPFHGTGIGTFATAYPPYAEVGFTEHAHNSFAQLAAELGYPGVLFLLIGLAAVFAQATAALRQAPDGPQAEPEPPVAPPAAQPRRASKRSQARAAEPAPDPPASRGGSAPVILPIVLAGLIASGAATVLQNLVDSDLYVPATALAFGALCGTLLGTARVAAGAADEDGEVGRLVLSPVAGRAAGLAAATVLLLVGIYETAAQAQLASATAAYGARDYQGAVEGYRSAAGLNPLDPEARLRLAMLATGAGDQSQAETEYRAAIQAAPIGKTYYRYGKFLAGQGRWADAIRQFEQARRRDPHYLDNLLALAEAYQAAGRAADAQAVYRMMGYLSRSPVGTVLAIPEKVDWQYGLADLALGEAALGAGDRAAALQDLGAGVRVLADFWRKRSEVAQARVAPETRARIVERYAWGLERYAQLLREAGRTDDAAKVDRERAAFDTDRAREAQATPAGQ